MAFNLFYPQWDFIPPFCLVTNSFGVDLNLVETVFTNINNILNNETLVLMSKCQDNYNTITWGPTLSGASGTTTRQVKDNQLISADVTIDVRVLQSCGVFFNVFLHEMLHALGLEHNKDRNSIMGQLVMLTSKRQVVQDIEYRSFSLSDIRGIQALGTNTVTPEFIFPSLNPSVHVSGSMKYYREDFIDIPNTPDNSKYRWWHLKDWFIKHCLK